MYSEKPKRMLKALLLLSSFLFYVGGALAQTTFTQTTDDDFRKGSVDNMTVTGNSVVYPVKGTAINNWLTATVLPKILAGHDFATKNNYVYLSGGYDGAGYSSNVYRSTIQSGNISNWTTLSSLPVGLRDHAMVIATNYIYVLGGRTDGDPFSTIYYATIGSDGSIGTWQTSAVSLPIPLWGLTAEYVNGYLVVVGGTNLASETSALNRVYYANVYPDGTLSSFTLNANLLPQQRNGHTMVAYDSKLYVLGGFNNSGVKQSTVYYATVATNGVVGSWATATALPVAVSNHASSCYNGYITVMGGASGGTYSNEVYYADIDAGPGFTWNLSGFTLYDRTIDADAFGANGQIVYGGGYNLSNTPILNTRYAPVTLGTAIVQKGGFTSNPFYELGDERSIISLAYTLTCNAPATYQVYYRLAGNNAIWGAWTLGAANPIPIGATSRYVQYMFRFTTSGTTNVNLADFSVNVVGKQLSGSLNALATLFKADNPHWATSNISFTSGTHTIQPGVQIFFLPGTGLEIGQANIVCNGNVSDSIKFTYFTNTMGGWNGIYFNPDSDNGVSSQFSYVIIENAGAGTNDAALYCSSSNEPYLTHSSIRRSDGLGISLLNSNINVETSVIKGNAYGFYLSNSNPSLISVTIRNNTNAGVYRTSVASIPNYSSCTIQANGMGIYINTCNTDITPPNGTVTLTGNTYNGICVPGGTIDASRTWQTQAFPYFVLDNILIASTSTTPVRLTIEPGNTVKVAAGKNFQIGRYSYGNQPGELYCVGTALQKITFTSINGSAGGWEGLYYTTYSDENGAVSVLNYCTVENANAYNILCENTNQPTTLNSIIRTAAQDGMRLNQAYNTIDNTAFNNNGRYPMYFTAWQSAPVIGTCTFTGNIINMIAHSGGHLDASRTLTFEGIPYYILDNMSVWNGTANPQLTVEAGNTLYFATGKGLQIGEYSYGSHAGLLSAVGTAGQVITFAPYDGTVGGWSGIYFHDNSDYNGAVSTLTYCTITKGSGYNIFCNATTQPSLDYCIISQSATYGIKETGSSAQIHNTQFLNNGNYPLYYTDWSCNSHLQGNTWTGSTPNVIALSGGQYTEDRTLYFDNVAYLVLDNASVWNTTVNPTLTLQPGVIMNFASGKGLQIGNYSYGQHAGELNAVGTQTQQIVFRPWSGTAGDWTGIYFHDNSDFNGAVSTMKHCIVEKGSSYNIYCNATTQPSIDTCIIRLSTGYGMQETGSSAQIHHTQFLNNANYPLYYSDWTCDSHLEGNTWTGNTPNVIALSGGHYEQDRTLYFDNVEYLVLDNISVWNSTVNPTLTLQPGVTMNFASGKGLQIGNYSYGSHAGELNAVGTLAQKITFRPWSGTAGDWTGIYFHDASDYNSAVSTLQYCIIEKGNSYDVYCDNTTQPTLEDCEIRLSLNEGVELNNSSPTLRGLKVTGNTTYGIYLNGTSAPAIGNNTAYSCDLFLNGVYEVYNNTTNSIWAMYNNWGVADSIAIDLRIYDKVDNSAKGKVYFGPFAELPTYADSIKVSGWVKYDNVALSPVKNANMYIKDFSNVTKASTTTNTSGVYTFAKIATGAYYMDIVPNFAWSGVTATDALIVLNHFAHIDTLSGLKMTASDVNASNTINGTDALYILKRVAGQITSFPSGNWCYVNDPFVIAGQNITANYHFLCYGDVNASFIPTMMSPMAPVILEYEGTQLIASGMEFDLNILTKDLMSAGAVTLSFSYPEEYLEVLGAELANGSSSLIYTAENGIFTLGWAETNPLTLNSGDAVITLKMKAKDLSGLTESIKIGLLPITEFADQHALVLDNVTLNVHELVTLATGVTNPVATGFSLSNYPNPFGGSTEIMYSLPEQGHVILEVCTLMGDRIEMLADQVMQAGSYTATFNAASLEPGVYLYKLTFKGSNDTYSQVRKMVVSY
jgi:parallel beta-helix repeat protein